MGLTVVKQKQYNYMYIQLMKILPDAPKAKSQKLKILFTGSLNFFFFYVLPKSQCRVDKSNTIK